MKIAFRRHESHYMTVMTARLEENLADHEFVVWETGKPPAANDFEAIVLWGPLGRAEIESQTRLAFVQTATAGYDGVDIAALTAAGIWAAYAPATLTNNSISVAELAVFLMIGASRYANTMLANVRDRSVRIDRLSSALFGKTACILGFGAIGAALADRLRAFGMHLVATGSKSQAVPSDVRMFGRTDTESAVADADYVIVCVPATQENEDLIDARLLAKMKAGSILINIARGTIVDEVALVAAIRSGHIAAAGLDVLKNEPADPQHPLLAFPQVFVTPHVAGSSDLMLEGTVAFVQAQIADVAAGRKPRALLADPQTPRRPLETRARSSASA